MVGPSKGEAGDPSGTGRPVASCFLRSASSRLGLGDLCQYIVEFLWSHIYLAKDLPQERSGEVSAFVMGDRGRSSIAVAVKGVTSFLAGLFKPKLEKNLFGFDRLDYG